MKTTKLTITLFSLVLFGAAAGWSEYSLARHSGIALSLSTVVVASVALLGALHRAPEGYEDDAGFHLRGRREQKGRPRRARLSQSITAGGRPAVSYHGGGTI
jgi:hypothetical protein